MTRIILDQLIRYHIAFQYYMASKQCHKLGQNIHELEETLPKSVYQDLSFHDTYQLTLECQRRARQEKRKYLRLLILARKKTCYTCQ